MEGRIRQVSLSRITHKHENLWLSVLACPHSWEPREIAEHLSCAPLHPRTWAQTKSNHHDGSNTNPGP